MAGQHLHLDRPNSNERVVNGPIWMTWASSSRKHPSSTGLRLGPTVFAHREEYAWWRALSPAFGLCPLSFSPIESRVGGPSRRRRKVYVFLQCPQKEVVLGFVHLFIPFINRSIFVGISEKTDLVVVTVALPSFLPAAARAFLGVAFLPWPCLPLVLQSDIPSFLFRVLIHRCLGEGEAQTAIALYDSRGA
ncbi:unnamed protein product [Calypogeia fissa]